MHRNTKSNIVRSGWPRRVCGGGFTLIELLIVLVILGITAAIAVPMASSAASMQLRSAANMVAADLEYAKSRAIATGQPHTVDFSALNDNYVLLDPNDDPISHPVKKGFDDYRVSFRDESRLRQVQVVSTNFGTNNRVTFDYLGTPYNSSGLPLTDTGTITLQAGDMTRTVSVAAVTGFISISD